jgi:hypothetical protein
MPLLWRCMNFNRLFLNFWANIKGTHHYILIVQLSFHLGYQIKIWFLKLYPLTSKGDAEWVGSVLMHRHSATARRICLLLHYCFITGYDNNIHWPGILIDRWALSAYWCAACRHLFEEFAHGHLFLLFVALIGIVRWCTDLKSIDRECDSTCCMHIQSEWHIRLLTLHGWL